MSHHNEAARQSNSPTFKVKFPLATIRGEQTFVELSQHLDVHTNQIKQSKVQCLGG